MEYSVQGEELASPSLAKKKKNPNLGTAFLVKKGAMNDDVVSPAVPFLSAALLVKQGDDLHIHVTSNRPEVIILWLRR